MSLNGMIGIFSTNNNSINQSNHTSENTHNDRRQSKATLRAPKSDKLIEDPTD